MFRNNIYAFLTLAVTLMTSSHALDTLYGFNEPIAQFTSDNFTETVVYSPVGWIVEFYASWCGHCQRLAPIWLDLASDMKGWHNVIRVGAVSCSDPLNAHLCRFYNIWSYPTVKYFPPDLSFESKGFTYKGNKTLEAMMDAIPIYLATQPILQPQRRAQDILDNAPDGTEHAFLITVDHRNQTQLIIAYQAILDASEYMPTISASWMNYYASRAHGVMTLPSLHKLDKDGTLTTIPLDDVNRRTMVAAMKASLYQNPTGIPIALTTTNMSDELPEELQYSIPSRVHMQDLESGLYYSLWIEVAAHETLDEDKREALLKHLTLLYKYIPYQEPILRFLNVTISWLGHKTSNIAGNEWIEFINNAQTHDTYVPQELHWAGCMGTLPKFRGYPCSVWMTYHTLTVAAYLNGATDPDFDPREVLVTLREYIQNLFGCRNCANHFVAMATGLESRVIGNYDGVLWLWSAHNKVNNRIQGDSTEDPNHPKVQFPSYQACPDCRIEGSSIGLFDNTTQWNIGKVIAYLTRFYDPLNLMVSSESVDYIYSEDFSLEQEEKADLDTYHYKEHGSDSQSKENDEEYYRGQHNNQGQSRAQGHATGQGQHRGQGQDTAHNAGDGQDQASTKYEIHFRERPTSTEPVLKMDDKQAFLNEEDLNLSGESLNATRVINTLNTSSNPNEEITTQDLNSNSGRRSSGSVGSGSNIRPYGSRMDKGNVDVPGSTNTESNNSETLSGSQTSSRSENQNSNAHTNIGPVSRNQRKDSNSYGRYSTNYRLGSTNYRPDSANTRQSQTNYRHSSSSIQSPDTTNYGQSLTNHRPDTTNFRQSSTNQRPDTTNYRQSSTNQRPDTTNYRQSSTNHRPDTTNYRQSSTNQRPDTTNYRQSSTNHRPDTTNYRQSSTNHRPDTTNYRQESTNNRQGSTRYRQSSTQYNQDNTNYAQNSNDSRQESTNYRRPDTTNDRQESTSNRQSSISFQPGSTNHRPDTTNHRQETTNYRQETTNYRQEANYDRPDTIRKESTSYRHDTSNHRPDTINYPSQVSSSYDTQRLTNRYNLNSRTYQNNQYGSSNSYPYQSNKGNLDRSRYHSGSSGSNYGTYSKTLSGSRIGYYPIRNENNQEDRNQNQRINTDSNSNTYPLALDRNGFDRRSGHGLGYDNRYTRFTSGNSRRRNDNNYSNRRHSAVYREPLSLLGSNERGSSSVSSDTNQRRVAYVSRTPCTLHASQWTACSVTCDTGTSSRFTNYNDDCEMRQETRLCQLRPCEARLPDWTRMDWHRQRCPQLGSTYRDATPRPLRQGNCQTNERRMWRYCGMCHSKCCYPADTRTITMDMTCDDGTSAVVKVMAYDYCHCDERCPMYY